MKVFLKAEWSKPTDGHKVWVAEVPTMSNVTEVIGWLHSKSEGWGSEDPAWTVTESSARTADVQSLGELYKIIIEKSGYRQLRLKGSKCTPLEFHL